MTSTEILQFEMVLQIPLLHSSLGNCQDSEDVHVEFRSCSDLPPTPQLAMPFTA